MNQAAWTRLENRFLTIVILITLAFLASAIGENKVQRTDPAYQPVGRGY